MIFGKYQKRNLSSKISDKLKFTLKGRTPNKRKKISEHRNFENQKSRSLNYFKIVGIVLISFVFFTGLFSIKVSDIECHSQYGKCNQEIENKIDQLKGKQIMFSKRNISMYLSNNTLVQEYSLQLKFPTKLELNIIEKKTNYALKNSETDYYMNVSEDGYIIGKTNETSLPILYALDPLPEINQKVDDKTLSALKISKVLYQNYPVEKAEKVGDNLNIKLEGKIDVLFPLDKDPDYILGAFVLIFNELNKEDNDIKIGLGSNLTLDLRYKNPVLRVQQ